MRSIILFILLLFVVKISAADNKLTAGVTFKSGSNPDWSYSPSAIRDGLHKTIVESVGSRGILYNLSAHHHLSQLKYSFKDRVARAKDYLDKTYGHAAGLTEEAAAEILNNEINPISEESYPDCASMCVNSEKQKYRPMDGSCNNLQRCKMGNPGSTLIRLLPPKYGKSGEPLSSIADVYNDRKKFKAFNTQNHSTSKRGLSMMAMNFGQILSHEITGVPVDTLFDGKRPVEVNCCVEDSVALSYEGCFPIKFKFGKKCMNFIRSAPGIIDRNGVYSYGHREQMAQVTSFIDGSVMYGNNIDEKDSLMDSTTGKLKIDYLNQEELKVLRNKPSHQLKEFMITSTDQYCDGTKAKNTAITDPPCFVSGDFRVNIHLGMMILHNLFLREHNRIIDIIKEGENYISPEDSYNRARRVMGAYLQVITFKEYLPAILGKTMIDLYGLITTEGTNYDKSVNPSIINSFTAAVFRMGHSQVDNRVRMGRPDGSLAGAASLRQSFFNPKKFYESLTTIRRYTLGIVLDKAEEVDGFFPNAILRYLFKTKSVDNPSHNPHLLSLPLINMQRGIDHGLPKYGEFKQLVQDKTGDAATMSSDNTEKLEGLYGDVNNADLFNGIIHEDHLTDSEIGPTAAHIIALQFSNLLFGDRYFYSHGNVHADIMFTEDQKKELNKITLAYMICSTAGLWGNVKITRNVMFVESSDNPLVTCKDVLEAGPDFSIF